MSITVHAQHMGITCITHGYHMDNLRQGMGYEFPISYLTK